jgi:hypothetical protein
MGGACITHNRKILNATKMLLGKSEWKRPLVEPRDRGENYIKVDLEGFTGVGTVDGII